MINDNNQGPQFTLEEIGEHFGRLLAQLFSLEITQKKEIASLRAEVAKLMAENDALHSRIYDAAIQDAKEKAAD